MKFTAQIVKVLPEQRGVSKAGKQWRRQSYVGIYDNSNAQYPKMLVFDVIGDKVDQFGIVEKGNYELEIDLDAREWQGRYFLSANCWKATRLDQPSAASVPASSVQSQEKVVINDLPF